MEYRELSNGVRMPVIGYGVFQIPRSGPNGACATRSRSATG